jgi:hypothetical protein
MRLRSRRALGPVVVAILAGVTMAAADEIQLKGGGRVSGRIVERTATRVAIETGPGRVTLPLARVERIVEGRSALEVFAERAADLGAGDVEGWADLARWAEERDLLTQARGAWQRVLATDPAHPEANAGIGRVTLDGEWMSADDAYRARGYVSYEGRWLTPAEHEAAVREREADAAAAHSQREADLRVQEAEARVREAEARAREAEAAAEQTSGGIPLDYAYGGYGYGYVGGGYVPPYARHPAGHGGFRPNRPHNGRPTVEPAPAPRPTPAPRPQTRPTRPAPRRQAAILPPQAAPAPKR